MSTDPIPFVPYVTMTHEVIPWFTDGEDLGEERLMWVVRQQSEEKGPITCWAFDTMEDAQARFDYLTTTPLFVQAADQAALRKHVEALKPPTP